MGRTSRCAANLLWLVSSVLTWDTSMKWVWLIGAGIALVLAFYAESATGLDRLALGVLALGALWFFDWGR